MLIRYRIAKAFVAKRFGPDKIEAPDMLGSFIKHGLDQRTAEAEAVLQVYVRPYLIPLPN